VTGKKLLELPLGPKEEVEIPWGVEGNPVLACWALTVLA